MLSQCNPPSIWAKHWYDCVVVNSFDERHPTGALRQTQDTGQKEKIIAFTRRSCELTNVWGLQETVVACVSSDESPLGCAAQNE